MVRVDERLFVGPQPRTVGPRVRIADAPPAVCGLEAVISDEAPETRGLDVPNVQQQVRTAGLGSGVGACDVKTNGLQHVANDRSFDEARDDFEAESDLTETDGPLLLARRDDRGTIGLEPMAKHTRDEAAKELRVLLMKLRSASKASQATWSARLGLSAKTISRWECGDRKPTRGQAIEVILALRDRADVDHAYLARIAELYGLDPDEYGVGYQEEAPEVVAPLAVDPPAHVAPPAAPPRMSPVDVRTRVDLALLTTAEELDMSPRGLRRGLRAVLEAAEASGYTVAELRGILGAPS